MDVVEGVKTYADVGNIITLLKSAVSGCFEIASSAFGFLMSNSLCAFMVGVGFCSVSLSLVRKAIRVSKRS